MWSDLVVVSTPIFDNVTGMFQINKPVSIQTLIPEPAVKALSISILYRLPWPDEIQLHTLAVSQFVQGTPNSFLGYSDIHIKGLLLDIAVVWCHSRPVSAYGVNSSGNPGG